MQRVEWGDPAAETVLIQPVDGRDLELMEGEIARLRQLTRRPFRLIACRVENWNTDLSPWRAPAVFGKQEFGEGAAATLREILALCTDPAATYYLGGYSLAGLFALWAGCQTGRFRGIAAASPSVWFPGFAEYMRERPWRSGPVYLSLGDREERTRNPVTAAVGERIREIRDLLQGRGIDCALEWNEGNHFQNADLRTAGAFAWLLERS